MDEARVREIVREEMDAAGVVRHTPMTPEERKQFTDDMCRDIGETLLEFQREWGTTSDWK